MSTASKLELRINGQTGQRIKKLSGNEMKLRRKIKMLENSRAVVIGFLSILCLLMVWQLAVSVTTLGKLLPGPLTVISAFIKSFTVPIGPTTILGHAGWSLSRVMISYVAAAISGIIIGVLMGWNRVIEAIIMPLYNVIRPIPPIAWIPLAILWFGLDEAPKRFLIFIAAFCIITMNAYQGARMVDPVLVGAAEMLGANKIQIFFTIILPASVPSIFAGLQVAVSSCWTTVVAAEMVRSAEGLGWVIISAQSVNNTTQMLVGIISIGLIGFFLSILMRKTEERLCAWNKSEN